MAANGRLLCEPGESFSSKAKATHNFNCVKNVFLNSWREECKD